MSNRAPLVVLLAGPNGAGKSTSADELLQGALEVDEFVNADTIASGLSAYRPEDAAIAAGRVMLSRLHVLARLRKDFAFETTLAGRGHARMVGRLRESGYRAHLIFLSLPSVELALARVAERVRFGGHDVPPDVVRRRFESGLKNLFHLYRETVDGWQVYDNSNFGGPRLIASGARGRGVDVLEPSTWNTLGGGSVVNEGPETPRTPAERVHDVDRILRALRKAVREALRRHKLAGYSVAVWRDGKVVWIPPEEIPDGDDVERDG